MSSKKIKLYIKQILKNNFIYNYKIYKVID